MGLTHFSAHANLVSEYSNQECTRRFRNSNTGNSGRPALAKYTRNFMDTLTISIGIGLAVSLLFSEVFGLAAGGMVVPGYIALSLDRPMSVTMTFIAAILTYFVVYSLSNMMIIYGKRRTVLMVLVGFLVGIFFERMSLFPSTPIDPAMIDLAAESADYEVIGYIIPGLIGIWIDRQGLVETLGILLTASTLVRLVLILLGLEFVL